jgi:DNA (cytosine-5)-methyltransferase 1
MQFKRQKALRVAGIFAGIGGFEVGLERAGHKSVLLCENDSAAQAVLRERFKRRLLIADVAEIESVPGDVDLLAAGFPCQDLSQVGRTQGLNGKKSTMVSHVFRMLRQNRTPWVLLENVPFMLQLHRGAMIDHIVRSLEDLGYRWAYRTVDTRAFGIPQRRHRVFLLASIHGDPASVLLSQDAGPGSSVKADIPPCGFYWTEGNRGLGWAPGCVPTLKGGSALGIPSPPAIWMPNGRIMTADIRDAERLQGFDADWTAPAEEVSTRGSRWRLVGNAVTTAVSEWLGLALRSSSSRAAPDACELDPQSAWPKAAFGEKGKRHAALVSMWPVMRAMTRIDSFLEFPCRPLSRKATEGFYRRLMASDLHYPPRFARDLKKHLDQSQ